MGRNWAIAIGINQYDNLVPLHYAKRDAEAVRDFCLQEVGFEKVYYFSDGSPPIETDLGPPLRSQPTFGTLSRFLRTRFEQPFLHPGDNFWFFFAGHGKRHRDRDYLMPMDVDPGDIERTAIPINYVTERLRRCGADNVILLLDACRNEGDRDGEGIGVETQQGVVTLFACSPNERSYEIDELQQGAFTHALLQGLRIQGEGNCATVERLYQHLRYQVPDLNRRYQKPRQTPYTIAEPATKLHLILLPKQATPADVTILKNDALEAEAEQDWELAEQLWTRVSIIAPGDAQALKAIRRLSRTESEAKSSVTFAALDERLHSSGINFQGDVEVTGRVVLFGPRPSGKVTFLTTLAYFSNAGGLTGVISSNIDEFHRLFYEGKYILKEGELLAPPKFEEELLKLSIQASSHAIRVNLTCNCTLCPGEVFDLAEANIGGDWYERALSALASSQLALIIDPRPKAVEFIVKSKYREKYIENTNNPQIFFDKYISERMTRLENLLDSRLDSFKKKQYRIAIVFSCFDHPYLWNFRKRPLAFAQERFPVTKSTIENWSKRWECEIAYFTCSSYGTTGNPPVSNASDGFGRGIKDGENWQPFGLISPIYWLLTGMEDDRLVDF